MNLELKRHPSNSVCTIGDLYVDGAFQCNTLEDVVREVAGEPVEEWKIPRSTAIPEGTYNVIINDSVHFDRPLPLLVAVPGFTGVRIHSGNVPQDTEGCILVGTRVAEDGNSILESRAAFGPLFQEIKDAINALEKVTITITNP